MDRREFLKTGVGLAVLTTSAKAMQASRIEQETSSAVAPDPASDHMSESSLVTQQELDFSREWYAAITGESTTGPAAGEWLHDFLGVAIPFSFRYGGEASSALLARWPLTKGESRDDPESTQQDLTWRDPRSGFEVRWHVKRFTRFPAIEWTLWFENAGQADTLVLEDIQDLNLSVKRPASPTFQGTEDPPFLVHGANGASYKDTDYFPFSHALPNIIRTDIAIDGVEAATNPDDVEFTLGGAYPSSRGHLPFFNIEAPTHQGVVVGIGWSGDWVAQFKVDGPKLTSRVGLKETHFVLHPGEQVRTARILLLPWQGKRLHSQNVLRRLLYEQYIPHLYGKPREPLVSINSGFTHDGGGDYLVQANEKTLLPEVQPIIRLGTELFIIDANWAENTLGYWEGSTSTVSKERYPHGLRVFADPLAASHVEFGLWFGFEDLRAGAPVVREHPEWFRKHITIDFWTPRMELPEVREYFVNLISEVIEQQGMTCYRQDGCNCEFDLRANEPADRKGLREIQDLMGLYAYHDELLTRHPKLIREAALGAPRIDLETLSWFHWHQSTETCMTPILHQVTTYNTCLWMPGGSIVLYTEETDHYGLWSSFGGQLSLAWESSDHDFPFEEARRQVELYKRNRAFLSGDFYPLTPVSMDGRWLGYQFHRTDLNAGCAMIFKRDGVPHDLLPESDTFRLQLRGLAPADRYRVHFESSNTDKIFTGARLATGVELALGTAPAAELVVYHPEG